MKTNRIFHISVLLNAFLLAAVSFYGCSSGKPNERDFSAKRSNEINSIALGDFYKEWESKTFRLGNGESERSSIPGMSLPGIGSGNGASGGAFGGPNREPISAEATLLDSALIEAGINEFAKLSGMSIAEKDEYKNSYVKKFKTSDHILIWLELSSSYTEETLDLNRWSFFFEDNKGGQIEPATVEEYKENDRIFDLHNKKDFAHGEIDFGKTSSKTILLWFPIKRYNGAAIIPAEKKSIKIVMYNWNYKTRLDAYVN
jgi:hypothetical protein